jgi:hypothetical protein
MAIFSPRLEEIIQNQADWYRDQEFGKIYNNILSNGNGTEVNSEQDETWQLIGWFANALAKNLVKLGDVNPGFNDDDRAGKFAGSAPAPVDTVIVHHTATKENLSVWELEALGLLRLYLPHFMSTVPNGFINFLLKTNPQLDLTQLAPASGHYVVRDSKEVQSFVGYHYVIYPDGHVENLLDQDHMGFHAGNLKVNIRSYGVAFVGDFSQNAPTPAAQVSFKKLLNLLRNNAIEITYLDSHTHVNLGVTECPGPWFDEFRKSEEFSQLKRLNTDA